MLPARQGRGDAKGSASWISISMMQHVCAGGVPAPEGLRRAAVVACRGSEIFRKPDRRCAGVLSTSSGDMSLADYQNALTLETAIPFDAHSSAFVRTIQSSHRMFIVAVGEDVAQDGLCRPAQPHAPHAREVA